MKQFLYSLMFATGLVSYSQAAIVYTNFNPDKVMTLADGSLSFDVDGDQMNDLTFSISGSGASDYVLDVSAPSIQFVKQNASANYTESLFIGKIVDGGKPWSTAGSPLRLASAMNKDIAGANEFFIGLRFVSGSNYFYGWMLVELKSNLDFVVKSFAFDNSLNKAIVVGNTGAVLLSLDQEETIDFSFYPTAVNDFITISSSENIQAVSVLNSAGQKVAFDSPYSKELRLNLSNLTSGNYIIRVTLKDGSLQSERFVKL
jgi:hypothetical protein